MPLYKINRIFKQAHSREKPPAMFETMRQHNQLAVVRLLVAVDLNGTNEKENHVHRLPYCILRKRAVNAFCLLGIDENFTASMAASSTIVYTWHIIIHLDKSHKKKTSVADATFTSAV